MMSETMIFVSVLEVSVAINDRLTTAIKAKLIFCNRCVGESVKSPPRVFYRVAAEPGNNRVFFSATGNFENLVTIC